MKCSWNGRLWTIPVVAAMSLLGGSPTQAAEPSAPRAKVDEHDALLEWAVSELSSVSYEAYWCYQDSANVIFNSLCGCLDSLQVYQNKSAKKCETVSGNHEQNLKEITSLLADIKTEAFKIGISDSTAPGDTTLILMRTARGKIFAPYHPGPYRPPCTDHLTPCNGRCVPVCDDPAQYP